MMKHYKDASNKVYGYKPKDIEVVEITIEDARALSIQPKTFEQELEDLNLWKRQETEKVAVSFATILLINGTHQGDAENGIRQSMLNQIQDKYDSDLFSIKEKYGVI